MYGLRQAKGLKVARQQLVRRNAAAIASVAALIGSITDVLLSLLVCSITSHDPLTSRK